MGSHEACSQSRVVIILLLTFAILVYLSGAAESLINHYIVNKNTIENYGMPTINCDEINQIRVDSGLPPLDCNTLDVQQYTSGY